ncbi:ankyrin repeat domain-containing protein [Kitasatospora sp. NPDC101235]|uniref:ankyrin repeat domain-containing protein n=1 Tax=Kitasatospora sp. NPDC101235 TaxID=3364101 RepID=UPI003814361E
MEHLPESDACLFAAVQAADVAGARTALAEGASPAARDTHAWTPLHWAAGRGDTELVDLLLGCGADPRAEADGRTPYDVALAAGRTAVSRTLARFQDGTGRWHPYCRAYPLGELRRFAAWHDTTGEDDRSVVYLHDDLTVTASVVPGDRPVFPGDVPGWGDFCRAELGFAAPDELDLCTGGPE